MTGIALLAQNTIMVEISRQNEAAYSTETDFKDAAQQVASRLACSRATQGDAYCCIPVTSRRGRAAVNSARCTAYRSTLGTSRRNRTADDRCCHPSSRQFRFSRRRPKPNLSRDISKTTRNIGKKLYLIIQGH
uniref:Uncharacterized protein n=1 Tax=Ixodes ricinus TaxID=34613 RepID=A0A6B0US65_IXORI